MNTLIAFRTLGPIDFKNLWRDSMLRWMLFTPLVMGLGIRVIVQLAREHFASFLDQFPFVPLLLNSNLALLNAFLFGMLVGFLLLDERDNNTLTALQTTPLSLNAYFAYRMGVPMLLSFGFTLLLLPLANIETVPGSQLILIAGMAGLFTPLFALAFASLAQNKVQGFALVKAGGSVLFPPVVAYFLPAIWQWPFYIFPSYWPVKLFWVLDAEGPSAWVYFVVGVLYLVVLNWLLLRHFYKVLHS